MTCKTFRKCPYGYSRPPTPTLVPSGNCMSSKTPGRCLVYFNTIYNSLKEKTRRSFSSVKLNWEWYLWCNGFSSKMIMRMIMRDKRKNIRQSVLERLSEERQQWQKDRQTYRQIETDRQTERQTETDRQTVRQTESKTERDRQTERQTVIVSDRQTMTVRQTETERQTVWEIRENIQL